MGAKKNEIQDPVLHDMQCQWQVGLLVEASFNKASKVTDF